MLLVYVQYYVTKTSNWTPGLTLKARESATTRTTLISLFNIINEELSKSYLCMKSKRRLWKKILKKIDRTNPNLHFQSDSLSFFLYNYIFCILENSTIKAIARIKFPICLLNAFFLCQICITNHLFCSIYLSTSMIKSWYHKGWWNRSFFFVNDTLSLNSSFR